MDKVPRHVGQRAAAEPTLGADKGLGGTMLLTLIGLVLEIIGVGILLRDELSGLAAILRKEDKNNKIEVESLFQKLPIFLAKCFGSSNSLAMESFAVEKFTKRFYGFCLLFFGFILQAVPVLKQLIGT